ncbi:MAG: hypothetical protein ACOX8Q_07355 [Christensenellales bacterium]|jgi:hypothetical protein
MENLKNLKHPKPLRSIACIICVLTIICTGCKLFTPNTEPSQIAQKSYASDSLSESITEESPTDTDPENTLPLSIEADYVIVQDYAKNETSKRIIDTFAYALSEEVSLQENADYRITISGKDVFMINACVPFEGGTLICGHILRDGEDYCKLYYFENGKITYGAQDSDIWSLNYTVFKDYTIAYGKSLGWDDKQDKVTAEFANGQTVSQSFANIPFKSEKAGWKDGSIETNGYILVANGLTWIKNIEFYDKDGSIKDDWHSDMFHFNIFNSGSAYVWNDQPGEIWTVYRYTQMLDKADRTIINEIVPLNIWINDENVEVEPFLINENIRIEYIWRNNNRYRFAKEVKNISDIRIQGIQDDDEVIWVALDKDDGSPISDYTKICSNKAPAQKGNYCLIIRHNGDCVLKHEDMYFSMFIVLI